MGKLEAELAHEQKRLIFHLVQSNQPFTLIDPALILTLPSCSKDGTPHGWILWYINIILMGIGMFYENFMLMVTGEINTIWTVQYPKCWKTGVCALCPNHVACCGVFKINPFEVTH